MFSRALIKKQTESEKGFTLIELVIVIVLLGISILPLSNLLRQNLKSTAEVEIIAKASFFAQQKIEQVLRDYNATGNANITPGDYSESNSGMTCSVSSSLDSLNGIRYYDVTVTVSGDAFPDIDLNVWLVD